MSEDPPRICWTLRKFVGSLKVDLLVDVFDEEVGSLPDWVTGSNTIERSCFTSCSSGVGDSRIPYVTVNICNSRQLLALPKFVLSMTLDTHSRLGAGSIGIAFDIGRGRRAITKGVKADMAVSAC